MVDASRYEPLRSLGRGGFGEVFLARDRETGETVALKVLNEDVPAEALARFERESEVLSSIDHPAIVKILGWGQSPEGRRFYAMPYVEGATSLYEWLHAHHRAASLPPDRTTTLAILRPLAAALDHIHARRVLHRDVKPSNVLVTPGTLGTPQTPGPHTYLIDFGLAGLVHSQLTETGHIVGTMGYLAPEQARGAAESSPASDQYQLGLVLYELMTGKRACTNVVDYVRALGMGVRPFTLPSMCHTGVGSEVEEVILQATESEPHMRFDSCTAMVGALEAIAKDRWNAAGGDDAVTVDLQAAEPADAPALTPLVPVEAAAAPQAAAPQAGAPAAGAPRKRTTGRSQPVAAPATPATPVSRAPERRTAVVVLAAVLFAAGLLAFRASRVDRFAPLRFEAALGSAVVVVAREPAGPVAIEVAGPGSSVRTFRSDSSTSNHRVKVDGLAPGDRISVRVLSSERGPPVTSFELPPPRVEITRVQFSDRGMDVNVETAMPVKLALSVPRLVGRDRGHAKVQTEYDGKKHRLSVPLDGFPFSTRWNLELSAQGESVQVPVTLPRAARPDFFARVATWMEERDALTARELFAQVNSGKRKNIGPVLAAATRDFPPAWLAAEWGGKDGVLDDPEVSADTANRFGRQLGRLITFDHYLELLGERHRYPHEMLYGERMRPALASRLTTAQVVPVQLEALDRKKPFHVLNELTDAEGMALVRNLAISLRGVDPVLTTRVVARFNLPRLPPNARVELVAPLICGGGRWLSARVNNAWEVRLGRWLRTIPAEALQTHYVPIDPRFLVPGENTMVLTVPPMPPLFETLFGAVDVVVVPPGFSLRVGS